MTTTTAERGLAQDAHQSDHHAETEGEISARTMYLLAIVIIGIAAGMMATMGLGGLILWAVCAAWGMLVLLVIMTAGG
ncbi:hypothetical protein FGG78_10280 [Thioclava sp. BHET1]|nr:hypothetical protein FGG78_10280 [Thioclava sp. BHET1]